MKQETIICGGENCDREATHLLMSVMLHDGRIPNGFLADVANPESTFPTCPVCLEEHAAKMENVDQRLSDPASCGIGKDDQCIVCPVGDRPS